MRTTTRRVDLRLPYNMSKAVNFSKKAFQGSIGCKEPLKLSPRHPCLLCSACLFDSSGTVCSATSSFVFRLDLDSPSFHCFLLHCSPPIAFLELAQRRDLKPLMEIEICSGLRMLAGMERRLHVHIAALTIAMPYPLIKCPQQQLMHQPSCPDPATGSATAVINIP